MILKKIMRTALIGLALIGCRSESGQVALKVETTNKAYDFEAHYPLSKTREIQEYLADYLKKEEVRGELDVWCSFGSYGRFKLVSKPGYVRIHFNKREQTKEAAQRLMGLAEGIKERINPPK